MMLGGLFAGTEEAPGEVVFCIRAVPTNPIAGMGSLYAMQAGSKDRYFRMPSTAQRSVPEGIEGRVPYRGAYFASVVHQLEGGILLWHGLPVDVQRYRNCTTAQSSYANYWGWHS